MSLTVIDASAAMSWLLPTQSTLAAEAFLRDSKAEDFVAPEIYAWEVANVLVQLERRAAITGGQYLIAQQAYADLNVRLAESLSPSELESLADLAREVELSLFDAAYLALAMKLDCALATRDQALAEAAQSAGIYCHDLRDMKANR
jgi:predicted nucleic acid-binding protein